ncbi:CRAL/TRIO domain-containing protein, partial [Auriscalpium vulgare]
MDARILNALSTYNDTLLSLYQAHLQEVLALQTTLLDQILPNLVDELGLDALAVQRATDWLHDTPSIFRMLKRHKFTASFALESMRMTLVWRLTALPAQRPPPALQTDIIHCLPRTSLDHFGRPVLVIRLAALGEVASDPRPYFLTAIELLRVNLKSLNDASEEPRRHPVLQYTLLLDMADVSMRSINVDLLTWYTRDVVPRFPGLLAAVFMINFSWTHSGVWNILKHVLPASALTKVFFPSPQTLHHIIPPAGLPQDYGGTLPPIEALENPLRLSPASP